MKPQSLKLESEGPLHRAWSVFDGTVRVALVHEYPESTDETLQVVKGECDTVTVRKMIGVYNASQKRVRNG